MIYLGISIIAISCFILGYKLGVYAEKIYLSIIFDKIIEDMCNKYSLENKEVAEVIMSTSEKFKTGEYNVVDLLKRGYGR